MTGLSFHPWVNQKVQQQPGIDMKLISAKFNVCHFEENLGDEKSFITCVYGAIDTEEKIEQQNYISELARKVDKPWDLIGDLNIFLDPDENQGGNKVRSSSKNIIIQIIDAIGLQDAGY